MYRINPRDESFSLLKIHSTTTVNGFEVCYGSVKYDNKYFYALYIIASPEDIWLWDARDDRRADNSVDKIKKKIKTITELLIKTESPAEDETEMVPVSIAVEGKPAIAAYLYYFREYEYDEIAEQLNVSEDTISKYFRRFRPSEVSVDIEPDPR